jgi:hypothetical protein
VAAFLLWLGTAAVTLLACWIGRRARATDGVWAQPLLGGLLALGVAACIVAGFALRQPEVPGDQFAWGLAIGAVGLGVLPALGFYTLGYFVRRPRVVGVVWFVATFPVAAYAFVVLALFALGVACEPGCLS